MPCLLLGPLGFYVLYIRARLYLTEKNLFESGYLSTRLTFYCCNLSALTLLYFINWHVSLLRCRLIVSISFFYFFSLFFSSFFFSSSSSSSFFFFFTFFFSSLLFCCLNSTISLLRDNIIAFSNNYIVKSSFIIYYCIYFVIKYLTIIYCILIPKKYVFLLIIIIPNKNYEWFCNTYFEVRVRIKRIF